MEWLAFDIPLTYAALAPRNRQWHSLTKHNYIKWEDLNIIKERMWAVTDCKWIVFWHTTHPCCSSPKNSDTVLLNTVNKKRRLCTLLTLISRQDWVYWLRVCSAEGNKWTCGTKISSQLHSWHLEFQQWKRSGISGSSSNWKKKKKTFW